jgi:hypothetical protein
VEGVDLSATSSDECRVLFHSMRVEAVDPERWVRDAVGNAIGSLLLRKFNDAAHAKRTQNRIIENSGFRDIRNTYAGVIDHEHGI